MANIRCGKCTKTHETVAAVKACYAAKPVGPVLVVTPAPLGQPVEIVGSAPTWEAAKQLVLIMHSCEDYDGECFDFDADGTWVCTFGGGLVIPAEMPAPAISEGEARLEAPIKTWKTNEIPAGRYALAMDAGTMFIEVQVGKKGSKWAGMRFAKHLVGAPGDFVKYPIRGAKGIAMLELIATDFYIDGDRTLAGPEAAAVRFSREFTCCAKCLAPLSDPISVATGLGPVCRKAFAA